MYRKFRILLALLAITILPSIAQDQYTIRQFTNRNGLPVNTIKGIEYDSATGLLWIGTEGGLCSFDGQNFTLNETVTGRVQTRLFRGVVYCYINTPLSAYILHGRKAIYAGTDRNLQIPLLYNADLETTVKYINSLDENRITEFWRNIVFTLDTATRKRLFIPRHTLYYLEGNQAKIIRNFNPEEYVRLFPSGKEALIVVNDNLYTFDTGDKMLKLIDLPACRAKNEPRYFILDVNTPLPAVVCGSSLYLIHKKPQGGYSTSLLLDNLPEHSDLNVLRSYNNYNLLALGSRSSGMFLCKRQSIKQSGPPFSGPNAVAYSQAELGGDTVLLRYGDLVLPDARNLNNHTGIIADNWLFTAANGNIWFLRDGSLYRYQKGSKIISGPWRLHTNNPAVFITETEGKIYVISGNSIHNITEYPNGTVTIEKKTFSFELTKENAIATEWAPGVLAFTAINEIILYTPASGRFRKIYLHTNTPVRALWRYGNYMFAGTYGSGIFRIDDRRIVKLPLDKNNYLNYAHCFVPDGNGFCWISSNNGLFKVSISALCNYQPDYENDNPIYYYYFGQQDGIINTEMNGGCQPCGLKLASGALSFPSMNGLVQVIPGAITAQPPNGLVLHEKAIIDSLEYEINDPFLVKIPSDARQISFDISIPYWGEPENLYSWYRLANLNKNWIPFDSRTQKIFSFNSLSPGKYNLEIKILNGFEQGNYKITHIPFTILQPWYKTWPALAVFGLLLICLIFILSNIRSFAIQQQNTMLQRRIAIRTRELIRKNDLLDLQLNELSKNNELKNRLISIISHNIITPLRYMHRAATSLKEGRLLDNPDLALRATVSIKDTAIELEQLSINLLNWIKFQHSQEQLQPEAFDVQEVIKQAVNLITPLCREKGLAQQLLNTEACSIRQYKDAMQVILYNLLINAVNYSNAGTVTVNLMCTTEYADLIVSDNGPGISAKMIERLTSDKVHETLGPLENKGLGFGYQIISDLLRLCGSSISIQSEGGTTVTVRFPCLPPEKPGINSAD